MHSTGEQTEHRCRIYSVDTSRHHKGTDKSPKRAINAIFSQPYIQQILCFYYTTGMRWQTPTNNRHSLQGVKFTSSKLSSEANRTDAAGQAAANALSPNPMNIFHCE